MTPIEALEHLKKIRDALAGLWSDVTERRGQCFVPPHPKPDFSSLDECVSSLKWENVDPAHQNRVDNIREAIHALRDEFRFSEQTLAFDPLKGHGFKFDAGTGLVSFFRYRGAQDIIDKVGMELHRMIMHQESVVND